MRKKETICLGRRLRYHRVVYGAWGLLFSKESGSLCIWVVLIDKFDLKVRKGKVPVQVQNVDLGQVLELNESFYFDNYVQGGISDEETEKCMLNLSKVCLTWSQVGEVLKAPEPVC